MSDEPPDITKEFVSKVLFEQELYRMYNHISKLRLQWTRQKINEVLDFLEQRQLRWPKKKLNEMLTFIVDNQMPKFLQETPIEFLYFNFKSQNEMNIASGTYNSNGNSILTFVPEHYYYDFLIEIHLSTNHGNFKNMVVCIKEKNYLIPTPPIITFLKLCKYCQNKNLEKKAATKPPELPPKPAVINLIDLQAKPADNYKWVLHYCDLNMKRSLLLPLRSNRAEEIASALIKNFTKTGCPTLLHSDGSDLITEVYKELIKLWPISKNIELQPCHQSAMDKICEDIMKLIQDWMVENDCMSWSFGVYFLQHKINCIFDETMIKVSTHAPSEENPLKLKKESTYSVDENKQDGAISLNEKKELKAEDKTNINENCGKYILSNALGDLNIALSG